MFWTALGRLVAIPLGLLFGALAAAVVLFTLGLERATVAVHKQGWEPADIDRLFGIALDGSLLLAGATIVPALAIVLIGEVARIRSLVYYVAGGGLALAAIPVLARIGPSATDATLSAAVWQVLATAGFAGGFVYWLVAGRWA